jgi:hypothetical protein
MPKYIQTCVAIDISTDKITVDDTFAAETTTELGENLGLLPQGNGTSNLEQVTLSGTGDIPKFVRFRSGGSPLGPAGAVFSRLNVNNFFMQNDDNSLSVRHSTDDITTPTVPPSTNLFSFASSGNFTATGTIGGNALVSTTSVGTATVVATGAIEASDYTMGGSSFGVLTTTYGPGTSGTHTLHADTVFATATLQGGGGGGGGTRNVAALDLGPAGGGGAGATLLNIPLGNPPSFTYAVAADANGGIIGGNGTNGFNTSIVIGFKTITAYGGGAGGGGTAVTNGGGGGGAGSAASLTTAGSSSAVNPFQIPSAIGSGETGPTKTTPGTDGSNADYDTPYVIAGASGGSGSTVGDQGGKGGDSINGYQGGLNFSGGGGAASYFGIGGYAGDEAWNGQSPLASAYGCGGGGAGSATVADTIVLGGPGRGGILIIHEYR